jgi:hypothetical protein
MNTIKVCDPRTAVKSEDEKLHTVLCGGMRYQQKVLPSNSWGTPGQQPTTAEFTYNANSTKNIVDRFMRLRVYLSVSVSGDELLVGQHDALRAFPLASIMDNLTCQINQETVSDRVADKIHALKCYSPVLDGTKSNSTSPNMPDQYQEYNDWQTYGSGRNPLSLYGESRGYWDTRGGFPIELSVDKKSFTCVVTEPLFISPFYAGYGDMEEGFSNINEININIVWSSIIERVLSHSLGGNNLSVVSVSFYRAPELLVTEITPDLTQPRLLAQSLSYNKLNQFPLAQGVLQAKGAVGDKATMTSDSFKLSQIPSHVYIFVRHRRQTVNSSTSDSYCGITNLRLTWNTETLFSSATQQDLFEMSKRNGCNLSWSQFSKYRGSVVCLSFGDQIGLIDGESAGVRGQYTLQVEADVENLSTSTFDTELFVVFNFQGSFSIMENTASVKIGLLTPSDVLSAVQSDAEMSYDSYKDLAGGGFWSSLKNIVHKVASGVSKVAPVVSAIAPQYADMASKAGKVAGVVGNMAGGRMSGGRLGRMGANGHGQLRPQYGSRLM